MVNTFIDLCNEYFVLAPVALPSSHEFPLPTFPSSGTDHLETGGVRWCLLRSRDTVTRDVTDTVTAAPDVTDTVTAARDVRSPRPLDET